MPMPPFLSELLASGQVPPEILQQMEAARDPALAQAGGGGFVQRGGEAPTFLQGQPPAPQQAPQAPQESQFSEFKPGPTNPTYADLFAENPAMGYAYLKAKGMPRNLYLNQIPLQGPDLKRYQDEEERRFNYFKARKDSRAAELALKRENRLEREAARREKESNRRLAALEEGKPLTVTELRDVRTDMQNMDMAEKALALLEGKSAGGLVGDKEATGLKGFVPDVLLQRFDPMGVDTRAALANIGSLRAQERSGGAIPAHEWERIKGFIPTDTDDPRTARKKLNQFLGEYRRALDNALQTFEGKKIPPGLRRDMERRAGGSRPSLEEILGRR